MPNYDDRLKDYVDVKERVRLFYEKHPDGRLETFRWEIAEIAGEPYVIVEAAAYRSMDDPRPGRGLSWLKVPGSTPYTRGSEIENAETSAWGRAIGALGIGIDKSIASGDEVRNKAEPETLRAEDGGKRFSNNPPKPILDNGDGSLIGVVEAAKDSPDFLPHVGPEGPVLTFKLVSPAGGIKVIATGGLAEVLATQKDDVLGVRVSCWGRVRDETFRPKGAKRDVTYQVLDLERIKTPTFTLPAPEAHNAAAIAEIMDSLPDEAPTAPLFTGPEFDAAS